jgi:hypothetical protein
MVVFLILLGVNFLKREDKKNDEEGQLDIMIAIVV